MISENICYHITVGKTHFIPAMYLLQTLRAKTDRKIVVVGNLEKNQIERMSEYSINYIDDNDIDIIGRFPFEKGLFSKLRPKYRSIGWYKQQFFRLCIDRYLEEDYAIIMDAEVFVFENWDEKRFFDDGIPKVLSWVSRNRKPKDDYNMYIGSAYLLKNLEECRGIMKYAKSDNVRRYISGISLFSRKNIKYLWDRLNEKSNLKKEFFKLFYLRSLCFSEYQFYGFAAEYGIFDKCQKSSISNELLGWYDNHDDPNFHIFKKDAMWSMCQKYMNITNSKEYYSYMIQIAKLLGKKLPDSLRVV